MRLGQPVDTPGFLEGWGRGLNLSLPGPYASLFQHLSFILFYFPVWRRRRCALSRCLFSPPAALFRDQAELGAGPVSQVNWAGSDPRLSLTSALRNNPSRFGRTFGEGEGGSLGKKKYRSEICGYPWGFFCLREKGSAFLPPVPYART